MSRFPGVAWWLGSASLWTGCAAPTVPNDVYYRLDGGAVERQVARVAAPATATDARIELWVEPFTVALPLQGDRLLAAVGPVRIEPYAHHRWVVPLDQLLDESARQMLTGLGFQVPGRHERRPPGDESLLLSGHVLEFHEVDTASQWSARARLQAQVRRVADGSLLWADDLTAEVVAARRHPDAVVVALSQAWRQIMAQVAARLAPAEPLQ
jgi:uncharacterized lipoprotein YmbA